MPHLPKMEVRFWKTIANETAPGGKVDMFWFDDPTGKTEMSFAVQHGRGDLAAEVGKRVNLYPQMLGLIDRMASALEPTALTSDKNRRALIQEAHDVLGIT